MKALYCRLTKNDLILITNKNEKLYYLDIHIYYRQICVIVLIG